MEHCDDFIAEFIEDIMKGIRISENQQYK